MILDTETESTPIIDVVETFDGGTGVKYSDRQPLRSELLSVEQMSRHGKRLAVSHKIAKRKARSLLLPRLEENETVLRETRDLIMKAVEENRPIAPASEWLLDNFYLIRKQIRLTRQHLPKGYSLELPRLLDGPSAGYPRVYDIALELIMHGDGRVDTENLTRFVEAYESVSVLTLGEIWAIPIMLRLALVENLRRVAARIAEDRVDQSRAAQWADRMIEAASENPRSLIIEMADLVKSDQSMSSAFVAEFVRRLQGQGSALTLPLNMIEQQLTELGLTTKDLIRSENRKQAADQVTFSNSIGSIRMLEAIDWREFVESTSSVERILSEDPAGVYAVMDFETRDQYRHVVERLARRSGLTEVEVAEKAVALAAAAGTAKSAVDSDGDPSGRLRHVGYYLIDKGLPALRESAGAGPGWKDRINELGRTCAMSGYVGLIAAVSGIIALSILRPAIGSSLPLWAVICLGLVLVLCASQFAVGFSNWLAAMLVRPRVMPRMEFKDGIPSGARTLVIVPSMLTGPETVQALLEGLEVRFLGNRDANVYFGLLSDFRDAPEETMPGDEDLLRKAAVGIDALNAQYAAAGEDRFFLFHRPRLWNPSEGVWMGYERKRGKLADLNSFLRGRSGNRFSLIVGDTAPLRQVRYVITLDSDTELPPGTARALAATMHHPLNRPVFDEYTRRVVDGYAIIQPRVAAGMPDESQSWFLRLFGGDPGIDPYTRSVSDVYQDLFGEGSFIGKGIYDVDAFIKVLEDRFPENLILSHDLLEGSYARAGLATDVQLIEDFPSRYIVDASRRHRWIRGDWQILHWLRARVPTPGGGVAPNPVSFLSQWKIFDNLRRSLVPCGLLLLFIVGWAFLEPAWYWTLAAAGFVFSIPILLSWATLSRIPTDLTLELHLRWALRTTTRNLAQAFMSLMLLPFEASFSFDAVCRTLARLFITRRRLLEWTTSSDSLRLVRSDAAGYFRAMWIGPFVSAAFTLVLALYLPRSLPAALPVLALWFVSPAAAWWMSRALPRKTAEMSGDQEAFLRKTARKTWRFFETFVGPEDNWLPPDNYQEEPAEALAHRTSPTNIGLSLLAGLTANDFGYLSTGKLIARTSNTFETLESLERYRRHFYNWYDTRTLEPLHPRYVSTVDSGNLAGHLLTLRQGLLELARKPVLPPRTVEGLRDTVGVLIDALEAAMQDRRGGPKDSGFRDLLREMRDLYRRTGAAGRNAAAAVRWLAEVESEASRAETVADPYGEARVWAGILKMQCRDLLADLEFMAPWTALDLPGGGSDDLRLPVEEAGRLTGILSLQETAGLDDRLGPIIESALDLAASAGDSGASVERVRSFRDAVRTASVRAAERLATIEDLAGRCKRMADFDYEFLFDRTRRLLAIGYNVSEHRRDGSFYDLLASEARLTSYVAIAQGHLPVSHWFALGRLLTRTGGASALISWGGSMFEYLMSLLVMPESEFSLLGNSNRAVVRRQIEYGTRCGVPWGMSESGYNTIDANKNYQYRSFGVPGLGFRHDLADDIVVAPYAAALALIILPGRACANLMRMSAMGFEGRFGFYEAIDYTPSRRPPGDDFGIVRSFMAHHQGMSLLSIGHALLDRPMQRRFMANPEFQAVDLLLHERVPRARPFRPHEVEPSEQATPVSKQEALMRVFEEPDTPVPEVHLLSNGRYNVMITNTGAGYSRWRDTAVTRWREDTTRDVGGIFVYLREVESGRIWSMGHHPVGSEADDYQAIFLQARAEFRRRDGDFDTHTQVAVSAEDDIELRRISVTNTSDRPRTIELTSYAEVVMAPQREDESHPAFSKLFVQTEIVREPPVILCSRRKRSDDEQVAWMFHMVTLHETPQAVPADGGEASFETDRNAFLGRCRDVSDPAAMDRVGKLGDSEGSVLDPVAAIRRTVTIMPEETAVIDVVNGVGESREHALTLAEKYHDRRLAERVFDLAWTHAQVVLRQLNATEPDAQVFGRLAGSIIFHNPAHRAPETVLMQNRRGQSGLWGYGISGDLPIVLLRISDQASLDLVRQLVQAHAYWNMKGVPVDLLIWNEEHSGYRQPLHDEIMGLVASVVSVPSEMIPGTIFVKNLDHIPEEDRILMQAVARVILTDSGGTLEEQVERRVQVDRAAAVGKTIRPERNGGSGEEAADGYAASGPEKAATPRIEEGLSRRWRFDNETGGFSRNGREYRIVTEPGRETPTPWSNVLANPQFGTIVTESGGSYTWSENAHEFRLTPWYNDPVSDACGEALYIRDEETGRYWSPAPLPARGTGTYVCRHGFGYTQFEHEEDGLLSQLTIYVSLHTAVKYMVLRVHNKSGRRRSLSATGYFEFVLGEERSRTGRYVTTSVDPRSSAILARNHYNGDFPARVAFVDVNQPVRLFTTDRTEFLGRNGSPAAPAAMLRKRLSGRTGAAMDPCAAMRAPFQLEDGQYKETVFILGCGRSSNEARKLIRRFRGRTAARRAYNAVRMHWNRTLRSVQIETPDPAVDILANGWLLYQTLSSRIWARSGYYQSGGAYGFRDQLQDVMALMHADPAIAREHLLRAASRQFVEGDVLHWWHPPTGRGVRTRFSDDYLWLPLAACRYVRVTGDRGVLDEYAPFLTGRPLNRDEEAYYDLMETAAEQGTLYDHCARAVRFGLKFGEHGLPLMGCGDWNDGMNLVGIGGRGESVWLGFFLLHVLQEFSEPARIKEDRDLVELMGGEAKRLRETIERNAWDGSWYLRAFFDNGQPLGSSRNAECRIDSLPQSWSVLSGAGDPARARQAMDAVHENLVDGEAGIVKLFDPPFDKADPNPGYIQGYVPGVRENGGQYTHAAVWSVMAFAGLGENRRAWDLLRMINPVNRSATAEGAATYKAEPYVIAADIYSREPHRGRGGWTWYTGSSSWMYRLILESLLGLRRNADRLTFEPRLDPDWDRAGIRYRHMSSVYDIELVRAGPGNAVRSIAVDGAVRDDLSVPLSDDGGNHSVEVRFGGEVGAAD